MLCALREVSVGDVQIVIDISEGKDGRAVGTVRAANSPHARPFSGNLELLALIESLYRISADTAGEEIGPSHKELP